MTKAKQAWPAPPTAPKQAGASQPQARKQVAPPPVYRPQRPVAVAQASAAAPRGPALRGQFRPPSVPPLFRAAPRVLQAASSQIGSHSTAIEEYKHDPRTADVRAAREEKGDVSGINYATFEVMVNGVADSIRGNSSRYHSEKSCWLALCEKHPVFRQLRIKSWSDGNYGGTLTPVQLMARYNSQITAVYTEREPCGSCAPLLYEVMLDPTRVAHSFFYPSKDTKKFQQPPEQVAFFGLLNLGPSTTGVSYAQTVDEHVRDGRVLGNKALKAAFK